MEWMAIIGDSVQYIEDHIIANAGSFALAIILFFGIYERV